MKYAVIIEKGSYGAQVPDLPGCVAVAETRDEVCKLIEEAGLSFTLRRWRKRACPFHSRSPMSWWSFRHKPYAIIQPDNAGFPGEAG